MHPFRSENFVGKRQSLQALPIPPSSTFSTAVKSSRAPLQKKDKVIETLLWNRKRRSLGRESTPDFTANKFIPAAEEAYNPGSLLLKRHAIYE